MKFIFSVLLLLISLASIAQVPVHEKKAFVDSAGNFFQHASLPVYLFISNSPNGEPMPLKAENATEVKLEGHGVHAFKHLNFVTKGYDEFVIHADGQAPVSTASLTGAPVHATQNRYYFGKGLAATVVATDEMSGMANIYHSVNSASFEVYKPLTFDTEGTYTYRHYALDRTGNAEPIKTHTFTVDLTPPQSFHNIVGISSQQVISTNSSIYLDVTDTLSGRARTFYKFDKENFRPYTGGSIAFQYLPDGDHVLTYFSVDNVANKEEEKSVKFYLDKTAPIMSADVLGDKFIVGERVYFSGRTKLKLTAVDNKSGIKDMMYSINEGAYGKYEEPFYLPGKSGVHNVKYYAIDQTANKVKDDFEHSVGVIYVDLTGPSLNYQFVGPSFVKADTVLVSPLTKINLSASDPESGLKKITYSIKEANEELPYTKPLDLTSVKGLHTLYFSGYDNVNNRNSRSTLFVVDTDGPEIQTVFAVAPSKEGKYPSYTSVYLSAIDSEVGTSEIRYSINGSKEQLYVSPLKGFAKNKSYTIRIRAIDLLGNVKEGKLEFKTDRY